MNVDTNGNVALPNKLTLGQLAIANGGDVITGIGGNTVNFPSMVITPQLKTNILNLGYSDSANSASNPQGAIAYGNSFKDSKGVDQPGSFSVSGAGPVGSRTTNFWDNVWISNTLTVDKIKINNAGGSITGINGNALVVPQNLIVNNSLQVNGAVNATQIQVSNSGGSLTGINGNALVVPQNMIVKNNIQIDGTISYSPNIKICRAAINFTAFKGFPNGTLKTNYSFGGLTIKREFATSMFRVVFDPNNKPPDMSFYISASGCAQAIDRAGRGLNSMFAGVSKSDGNISFIIVLSLFNQVQEMNEDGTGNMDIAVFW